MRLAVMSWIAGLLLVGCGPSEEPPKLPDLLPAGGTVTADGKPLEGAVVIFIPTEKIKQGYSAMGVTNAEGRYEVQTRAGQETHPGVGPGEYDVIVTRMVKPDGTVLPPDPSQPPAMSAARESIAPQFAVPGQTPLKANVAQGKDTFDFEVKLMTGSPP